MWSDNESSLDLLGCQHLVEVVTSIIKADSLLPATIGVFGDWGSGKTSLLHMIRGKLEQDKNVLVLSFNGWTFEGYDDARTALMSTILDEVASKATLTAKGKRLAVKLIGRVNVMRVLGAGVKAAIAFGMGGPAGLGLSVGSDIAKAASELLKKTGDLTEEDLKKFVKDEPAQEVRRSIREFREEFEQLIKETDLKTLVVVIDDLDRCMPDTIIETLEAIKLFLFAHKTAFILGADERLVKYAVRRRFPELPGERVEVGQDYLEKLVQFPVRIPPLGRTEIETYINLLFAKSGLNPEQFETARERATSSDASSFLDVRFNHGVAADILKPNSVPQELADNLAMAQRIAPFLANTSGYPRQCKRFLNMLVMRLAMAKARKVHLEQRVLAKLMLLEYFRPASFKKLAELQASERGRPVELAMAESAIQAQSPGGGEEPEASEDEPASKSAADGKQKPKKKAEPLPAPPPPLNLPPWLSEPWTKEWLTSAPPLADKDLRPYFYFSRDTLGQLGVAMSRLSPLAQQILTELFDKSQGVRNVALKKARELNPDEAVSVFEALSEKARQEEDATDDRSALQRCLDWAKSRPELTTQLFTMLENMPVKSVPVYVIPRLLELRFSMDDRRFTRRLIEKWAGQSEVMKIKSIAQSRLEQFTD